MARRGAFLTALFFLALFGTSTADEKDGAPFPRNVEPQEAFTWIRESAESGNLVILDVRTPGEFDAGHIAGAVLIDFRSPSFRTEVDRLDRGKAYLVYCRTSNRSARAVGIMKELGFRNLFHLAGGVVRWSEMGLPVIRTESGERKR